MTDVYFQALMLNTNKSAQCDIGMNDHMAHVIEVCCVMYHIKHRIEFIFSLNYACRVMFGFVILFIF